MFLSHLYLFQYLYFSSIDIGEILSHFLIFRCSRCLHTLKHEMEYFTCLMMALVPGLLTLVLIVLFHFTQPGVSHVDTSFCLPSCVLSSCQESSQAGASGCFTGHAADPLTSDPASMTFDQFLKEGRQDSTYRGSHHLSHQRFATAGQRFPAVYRLLQTASQR